MSKEDLQFVADALLALCDAEPVAPYHTERVLDRKIRRDRYQEPVYAFLMAGRPADVMFDDECREIFEGANLTERQHEVLRLRIEGHSFLEIGQLSGRSKQGIQNIFVQALKKLALSYNVYPYTGLSDVYRAESHRGLRRGFGTMHR